MKDLDQMTPMEIVHSLFNELKSLNKRLDKIEETFSSEKSNNSEDIMTVDEAAEYLKINKGTLYRYTSTNKIPFYKTGKRIYFKREHLNEYMTRYYCSSQDDIERMANEYMLKNPLK